jgi:hypothetical protein
MSIIKAYITLEHLMVILHRKIQTGSVQLSRFNPSVYTAVPHMRQYVVNEVLWGLVKPISVVLLSVSNKRFLPLKAASVDDDYI